MQLIEVTTPQLAKDFIRVNVQLHKNNTNYIRPLDKDIEEVFNKEKNKFYLNCQELLYCLYCFDLE